MTRWDVGMDKMVDGTWLFQKFIRMPDLETQTANLLDIAKNVVAKYCKNKKLPTMEECLKCCNIRDNLAVLIRFKNGNKSANQLFKYNWEKCVLLENNEQSDKQEYNC